MTAHVQKMIDEYLDAVGQVHGSEYRDRMVVNFDGSHSITVKHPDVVEGEVVPVGHLELMTKNLLESK